MQALGATHQGGQGYRVPVTGPLCRAVAVQVQRFEPLVTLVGWEEKRTEDKEMVPTQSYLGKYEWKNTGWFGT